MANYGKLEYWDERYSRDLDPFDWLQRFSGLKTILNKQIKLSAHILHVGCGTSRIPEEMAAAGYKSITSIDFSPVVISHMQEKYKDHSALSFSKMNALSLEFSDNSFEAVIAKGTIDTILCGENSTANVDQMLNEVNRVLKPGGVFVVVSCAGPESRNPYFERSKFPKWKTEVFRIDKPQVLSVRTEPGDDVHFVYLLYKE